MANITDGPSKTSFLDANANRRTIYTLQATSSVPDSTVVELAEQCLLTVPSAFNTSSTRITVLLKAEHQKLWDIAGKTLLARIGEERYNSGTAQKIANFRTAYGSILFWDDPKFVDGLRLKAGDMHAPKAEEWTHQSNGMHQYFMWTALETFGMGANLQHYNPLIDKEVQETWGLPDHWVLKAQLVFGERVKGSSVPEKEQRLEMSERLHVFGSEDK